MLDRTYISSVDFNEKFPLMKDAPIVMPAKVRKFLLAQAADARQNFKFWESQAREFPDQPEKRHYCYACAYAGMTFFYWLRNITLYHLQGGIALKDIAEKLSCLYQERQEREADILDQLVYMLAGN